MAWTTPTVRITAELITASIWNVDIVADLIELRAGGLALSGQAANSIPYASSTTQFTVSTGITYDGSSLTLAKTNALTSIIVQTAALVDGYAAAEWKNSLTTAIVGVSRTAAADIFTGSSANAFGLGTLSAHSVQIGTNGVVRFTIDSAGLLAASVASAGAQTFTLTNTTSGAAAYAAMHVVGGTTQGSIYAFSQGYTTAGADVQASVELYGSGAGGISILAGNAAGIVRVYANGSTQRMQVATGVTVGSTTDPGNTNLRVEGTVHFGGSATTVAGFLAYNSSDDSAQASGATVDFNTEVYDEAGNFSADTFTAPVAGRYLLTAQVYLSTFSTNGIAQVKLITSNRTYFGDLQSVITTDAVSQGISVIADMDAGDTAYVVQIQEGTVTVKGGSDMYTYFSGRLLP